jgi:hypothetical protein
MAKKVMPKNEFRKHKDSENHPHYVFGRRGNYFESIGLTTSPKTAATKDTPASKNIPLLHNPNPNSNDKSYARPFSVKRHKDSYKEPLAGWGFHKEDLPTIEKIKKRGEPLNGGMVRHKVKSITGHTQHTASIIRKTKPKVNHKSKRKIKGGKRK